MLFRSMARIEGQTLGADNVRLARGWLDSQGIAIIDEDVLGHYARRVVLDVSTGMVRVHRVSAS